MIRIAVALALCLSACAQMPWEDGPAGRSVSNAIQKNAQSSPPAQNVYSSTLRIQGNLINASGDSIGDVSLLGGPNGFLMEVTVVQGGLMPGWHGLHLHQIGDCSDIGEFKRSGGHLGKVSGGHGLLNPDGPESGDWPNIWAAENGSAALESFSTFIRPDELTDQDGVALIIHEGRDDHLSQPIGGAGGRVACAALQ